MTAGMRTLAGIDGAALGLRLSGWLFGVRDAAATRERNGWVAGALFLASSLYAAVVLLTVGTGDQRAAQVVVLVLSALSSAGCYAVPWRRLPEWAVHVPTAWSLALLTFGVGAAGGVLGGYIVGYFMIFVYVGLTCRPASAFLVAVAAEIGLAFAAITGAQHANRMVIAASIVVSVLIGQVPALATSWNQTAGELTVMVGRALEELAVVSTEEEASHQIASLVASLVDADEAVVLLTEHAGSATFVRRGGYAPRIDASDIRIEPSDEPSGISVLAHSRAALFIADTAQSPIAAPRFAAALGIASAFYLPILGEGGMMGVVIAWWTTPRKQIDPFSQRLAEMVTMPAGQVLQRVRHTGRLDSPLMRDPLTAVGNRRRFDLALTDLPVGGTILLFDLDAFAAVNDMYGRNAGDEVLRGFADALRRSVRVHDTVARFGDDTFVVVLPSQTSPIASGIIIERLQRAWRPVQSCQFSVGIATRAEDESASETLVRAGADLRATKRLKVR